MGPDVEMLRNRRDGAEIRDDIFIDNGRAVDVDVVPGCYQLTSEFQSIIVVVTRPEADPGIQNIDVHRATKEGGQSKGQATGEARCSTRRVVASDCPKY